MGSLTSAVRDARAEISTVTRHYHDRFDAQDCVGACLFVALDMTIAWSTRSASSTSLASAVLVDMRSYTIRFMLVIAFLCLLNRRGWKQQLGLAPARRVTADAKWAVAMSLLGGVAVTVVA